MLPAERWKRLETLFRAGVDLPPDQFNAYLDDECIDDPELREEVLSLLQYDRAEDAPLEDAIKAGAADFLAYDPRIGETLGPYRIEREIGRGGMAVVYLAVRADGEFRKRVAVKLIRRGMDTDLVVARLRRERRILAAMEHSSIASLLDGGTTSDGCPWIAMEYVEGLPIDRFCRENRLTIEERCRLIEKVCDAIAYAHRHLVVHRDLKPTNVLVTPDANPKVLDFGIARLLTEEAGDEEEPLTRGRSLPLTPEYASPEQLQGEPVTTASDVYSLGVVFYEVLTGERPHRMTGANLHELERVVCDTDAEKPSALPGLPRSTRRRLAGDLDNIVLKALHKDVSRRYGSAEQLADDIHRHLRGLPVRARRDTLLYRASRFLSRNRMAVAAGFLVSASAIAGTVIDIREAHAAAQRFDELRGFARTVLVDLHAQLSDVPGTAKARQALVTYVNDYLRRVAAQHSGDDTALAAEFATTYLRLGEMQGATPDAVASFENGRRLLERKGTSAALNPADSLVLARLRMREGSTLVDLGRTSEGEQGLIAAATLAGSTGASTEAELVQAFVNWRLGRLCRIQNRLRESEEHARKAVATSQDILRRGLQTREVYEILNGAGNVLASALRREGNWPEAMDTYRKVLADTEQRAAADPASAILQRELARSHQILGDMVVQMPGRENEVRHHVRSAIAIAERLAAVDPRDKTAQFELAQYLSTGAETLRRPEDSEEAGRYLQRALPILETLLKTEPGNDDLRLYAALTEADMGKLRGPELSPRAATLWLRRGMSDLTKLVESNPKNVTNQLELIKVQGWLALSLARERQEAEAVAVAQEAIGKARFLIVGAGATLQSRRELPRSYAAMAATYAALGKGGEARKWYGAAIEEWEKIGPEDLNSPDDRQEIADARRGSSGR